MAARTTVWDEVSAIVPGAAPVPVPAADGVATAWVAASDVVPVISALRDQVDRPFRWFVDLTAIDERLRRDPPVNGEPRRDFTVVTHLCSPDRNEDVRIKVALEGDAPVVPSITPVWPVADWYEREAFDMFGVRFDGHPRLRRILMPQDWVGHPLRKEHTSRGTDMAQYRLPEDFESGLLKLDPDELPARDPDGFEAMTLNVGPNHPATHGVLRLIIHLAGERILAVHPDIGFHHRGAEKIGERQTFHTYIPYTDRVDYLAGVQNELPYLMAVERLAGIRVPPRAQTIRVLLAELSRISSHLVWLGTFGHDVGAMSPVFYAFEQRERILDIVETVTGGRMHPGWFRIGGTAADLPDGWHRQVREFVSNFPKALRELDRLLVRNAIFRARTRGVGRITLEEAWAWGVSGPNLRSCGTDFDMRKKRPYSGYEHFDFEVPTDVAGDCLARATVRIEEMRESLRIVEQAAEAMPEGDYLADHPLCMPPRKANTMRDIETLIHHFLGVAWGHPIPAGEAAGQAETPKGRTMYYVTSDGGASAYRLRIRTPTFAHIQLVPRMARGHTIADLMAILGSIDFILAELDR